MPFHVRLAAALFIVWGALTALLGFSTFSLGVAAAALATSPARAGDGAQFAAGLTAATFLAVAIVAIVWGAAHIWCGLMMRRRLTWSRHLAIVLGTIDLFLLPYGTALGSYGLWALLSENGRSAFESSAHPGVGEPAHARHPEA
jgi:hypothetical protein